MANDWRPLPNHTRLSYAECYAKLVLEKFFPDEYQELQLSDRPDLRDVRRNIGIEVTSANDPHDEEAQSLACEIPYLDNEEQKKKRIHQLEKMGYHYTKYGMTGRGRHFSWNGLEPPAIGHTFCSHFIEAVTNKLKKLNSGKYATLSRYDLFVESEVWIDDWMRPQLLDKLISLSTKKLNYTFIYLLALNGLFVFDLVAKKYRVLETGEKLWGLGDLAREMVEKGERK